MCIFVTALSNMPLIMLCMFPHGLYSLLEYEMNLSYLILRLRPWKGFWDTGILAKNLKGYWIIMYILKGIRDTWINYRDMGTQCFLNFGDLCHIYFIDMGYFSN